MNGADLIAPHPANLGDLIPCDVKISVDVFDVPDHKDVPRIHDSNRAEALCRPYLDAQFFE
jgi:hypothetical protein